MKTNRICLFLIACLLLSGCDYVQEKGEILSIHMTSANAFTILVKSTNDEVKPISFTYNPYTTNIHIYADIKDGEPMWYEGNRCVESSSYDWLNVHINGGYNIKLNLEKKDN